MEKYVAEEDPTVADLRKAIRKATIAGHITPVLCGSAFKNWGDAAALNAVVEHLPSPLDVPPDPGDEQVGDESAVLERRADDGEPFLALAFKIMSDPYVGKLTYFPVYSGTLKAGSRVLNASKDERNGSGGYCRYANHREDKDLVFSGDIVAAVGLKFTTATPSATPTTRSSWSRSASPTR